MPIGRLLADAVTFAPGTQLDQTVGRLTTGYNERGLVIRSTSLNAAGTDVVVEGPEALRDEVVARLRAVAGVGSDGEGSAP